MGYASVLQKIKLSNMKITFEQFVEIIETENLDGISNYIEQKVDVDTRNQFIHTVARWKGLRKDNVEGIIKSEDFLIERNKIYKSFIEIADKLDIFSYEITDTSEIEKDFKIINKQILNLFELINEFLKKLELRHPEYQWLPELKNDFIKVDKKWNEKIFNIAIVALIKSGKSTLINAFIGQEYLPSASLAETMSIVKIKHNNNLRQGVLFHNDNRVSNDHNAIRSYLRDYNKLTRDQETIDNNDEILLEVNIESLKNQPIAEYGFEILDTPGTNESGISPLKPRIERLLKSVDVIIYVLDYTRLKSEDEATMLNNIKAWRPDLLEEISKRMFFVVNKIDAANRHDKEQNLGLSEVKNYVKNLLEKEFKSITINEGSIHLISAEEAMLGKVVLNGTHSEAQFEDFKEKAFGTSSRRKPSQKQIEEEAKYFIEDSNFTKLETEVLYKIYSKSGFILLHSVTNDLKRHLELCQNNLNISLSASNFDIEHIRQLKNKIDSVQKRLERFILKTDQFKKKANIEIDKKFSNFHEGVRYSIENSFSKEKGSSKLNILPRSFTDFLKITDLGIEFPDKSTMMITLNKLNIKIFQSIQIEFDLLWNSIADSIFSLFQEYNLAVQNEINPIKKQIESTIQEELNITLNQINIYTPAVDFNKFYDNLEKSMATIVKKELRMYKVEKVKEDGGLKIFGVQIFKWNFFKLDIKIMEEITFISSRDYVKEIVDQIKPLVSESKRIATEIIENQFIQACEQAKEDLNRYTERYIGIIEQDIKIKNNFFDVEKRQEELKYDLEIITKILEISTGTVEQVSKMYLKHK
jgi:small GTP-binding protein